MHDWKFDPIMGLYKNGFKKEKKAIFDQKREEEVKAKAFIFAEKNGLNKKFIEDLFQLILKHSRLLQEKRLGKQEKNR